MSKIELLKEAFDYVYPLVAFDCYKRFYTNAEVATPLKAPTNQFYHAERLSTPEDHLPAPNLDTVYSQGYFDVKEEPIVIKKAKTEMGFSICVNDTYGDCVAIIGTGSQIAKKYNCGYGNADEGYYALVGPGFDGELPEGITPVPMPTNMAYLLVRIKVDEGSDIEEVHRLQQEMHPVPLSQVNTDYAYPYGTLDPENTQHPMFQLSNLETEYVFNTYNSLASDNPGKPEDVAYAKKFEEVLVGPGLEFSLDAFTPEEQEEIRAIAKKPRGAIPGGVSENNWEYMPPRYGFYDGDYPLRAYLSFTGFGQNFPEVSMYATLHEFAEGEPLTGKSSYKLHFPKDGFPPCEEGIGYWALSPYYAKDYMLIPNEIRRYGLSSTSDLKYNEDGSLDIFFQKEAPAKDWVSNWIPVDDDPFIITLRLYYPGDSVMEKLYAPPKMEKVEG